MWEIWANKLLPNPLKSCLKFNKSPNLVTLVKMKVSTDTKWIHLHQDAILQHQVQMPN